MDYNQLFQQWLTRASEDAALGRELVELRENQDDNGITDRFYRDLEFGTGGLRGELGAGTNRMNIYTVRKATQGLGEYLNSRFESPSCAIAYDSRINSRLFASEAARVLAANGIKAYLYPRLMPTPALSFAVRHLGCSAGICVTASHNPAKYNGYKVYGPDGCQITLEAANAISASIQSVDPFDDVRLLPLEQALSDGKIIMIPEEVRDAFLDAVYSKRVASPHCRDLKVVYTPLNGAGKECVLEILGRIGVTGISVVPSQSEPDGNFPTCPYPNPEIREALAEGLRLCDSEQPDILLATDPDCDRVGIAVRHEGSYELLNGNEVGVLLLDYLAAYRTKQGTMPDNPVAVKTIVTTDMAQDIADTYGIELRSTLTGFKFIGEQIGLLEQDGEVDRYLFGFEESYGYLSAGHVRDKDAVNASMLICEMAADYKAQGIDLVEAMQGLYRKYGFYRNALDTAEFAGAEGMETMQGIMQSLRNQPPKELGGLAVVNVIDYLGDTGIVNGGVPLPSADVIEFGLAGGAKLMVRPSGTEPKIKVYLSAKGKTVEEADQTIAALLESGKKLLQV